MVREKRGTDKPYLFIDKLVLFSFMPKGNNKNKNYLEALILACAAASLAIGTLKGDDG